MVVCWVANVTTTAMTPLTAPQNKTTAVVVDSARREIARAQLSLSQVARHAGGELVPAGTVFDEDMLKHLGIDTTELIGIQS